MVTFFLGILCARWVAYMKSEKLKMFIDGFLTLPLVLPPTVMGFFLLLIFGVKRPIENLFSIPLDTPSSSLGGQRSLRQLQFPFPHVSIGKRCIRTSGRKPHLRGKNTRYVRKKYFLENCLPRFQTGHCCRWRLGLCQRLRRVWSYHYACRKYCRQDQNPPLGHLLRCSIGEYVGRTKLCADYLHSILCGGRCSQLLHVEGGARP